MRKLFCILLALALLCGAALAEIAYVTISDDSGKLCLAYTATEVSDVDEDGVLTVYDALYCAHEQYYEGGAAAGFGAEATDYGVSLTKLWGVENGGSYGYYIEHNSCLSLDDPIEEGAHIQAYAFQDLENWSDTYCYFSAGDGGALTLIRQGHDADWNVVESPVAGAKLTLNGEDTGLVTDESGTAILETPAEPGVYTVSATCEGEVLVPPVYVFTVQAAE